MYTGEKVGGKKETIKVCMQRSQWEHHAPLDGSRHLGRRCSTSRSDAIMAWTLLKRAVSTR